MNDKVKAIVQVGYTKYVMGTQQALTLLELLAEAEVYETKYRGSGADNTHHIYPQDTNQAINEFKVIPTAFYQMAKLAGKPEKD
jgi:hypothetical protein